MTDEQAPVAGESRKEQLLREGAHLHRRALESAQTQEQKIVAEVDAHYAPVCADDVLGSDSSLFSELVGEQFDLADRVEQEGNDGIAEQARAQELKALASLRSAPEMGKVIER